jgi:TIR domain
VDEQLWRPDHVRLFIAHSAAHSGFAEEIARKLGTQGIDGFVSHHSARVSRAWQNDIAEALRSADVMVGLVHAEFADSPWIQQELGWGLGRGLPLLLIRLGGEPVGLPSGATGPGSTIRARTTSGRTWLVGSGHCPGLPPLSEIDCSPRSAVPPARSRRLPRRPH